jgi:hypothetical protein
VPGSFRAAVAAYPAAQVIMARLRFTNPACKTSETNQGCYKDNWPGISFVHSPANQRWSFTKALNSIEATFYL